MDAGPAFPHQQHPPRPQHQPIPAAKPLAPKQLDSDFAAIRKLCAIVLSTHPGAVLKIHLPRPTLRDADSLSLGWGQSSAFLKTPQQIPKGTQS